MKTRRRIINLRAVRSGYQFLVLPAGTSGGGCALRVRSLSWFSLARSHTHTNTPYNLPQVTTACSFHCWPALALLLLPPPVPVPGSDVDSGADRVQPPPPLQPPAARPPVAIAPHDTERERERERGISRAATSVESHTNTRAHRLVRCSSEATS